MDVWLYEEKRAQGGCRRRGPGGMFGCIRRSGLREVVGGEWGLRRENAQHMAITNLTSSYLFLKS